MSSIEWTTWNPTTGCDRVSADWIQSVIDQCQTAGVPVFVKQLGSLWARQHATDPRALTGPTGHSNYGSASSRR